MYIDNNIDGWMTPKELQWLFQTSQKMDSVVEIGSWKGRSTHALLSGCPKHVFAIDHFKGSPDELDKNHREALHKDIYQDFNNNVGQFRNLITLKMDSIKASRLFEPKTTDMIFIDGSHTYQDILADIQAWLPKCKKILCGHDINLWEIQKALEKLNISYAIEADTIWSYHIK